MQALVFALTAFSGTVKLTESWLGGSRAGLVVDYQPASEIVPVPGYARTVGLSCANRR